jgi:hypothetical protein
MLSWKGAYNIVGMLDRRRRKSMVSIVEMVYLVGEFVRLSWWHTVEKIGFRDSETRDRDYLPYFYQR